jgi:hypothetical protein
LLKICHKFAASLPRVSCKFAVTLLDFYHNFAAILPRASCELSGCLQLICRVFAANLLLVCMTDSDYDIDREKKKISKQKTGNLKFYFNTRVNILQWRN